MNGKRKEWNVLLRDGPRAVGITGGRLLGLALSILQDQFVNDFSTRNTLPSKETILLSVKFLIGHHAATSITFHTSLPGQEVIAFVEMLAVIISGSYALKSWNLLLTFWPAHPPSPEDEEERGEG